MKAVPENCAVEEARQVVDLVTARPQNIVEFFYTCWPPAPPVALKPAIQVPPSPTSTDSETNAESPGAGGAGSKALVSTTPSTTTPSVGPGPTAEVPTG